MYLHYLWQESGGIIENMGGLKMVIKVAVPEKFQFKLVPSFRNMLMAQKGEVHYIGGSDVLPLPLEPEQESMAIDQLGTEKEKEAKTLLIEHNLRLVVYIAKKFDNTGVGVEDLISIGTIGLIKAINTFNKGKNIKLATYASRCVENEILMFLRKNKKRNGEISFEDALNYDAEGNELHLEDILGTEEDIVIKEFEDKVDRELLKEQINLLDDREKEIMIMRYGLNNTKEYTQKEVANILGISQSYISRIEKKVIRRLKNVLKV